MRGLIREARALLDERKREHRERWRKERTLSAGEGGVWLKHQLVNVGTAGVVRSVVIIMDPTGTCSDIPTGR